MAYTRKRKRKAASKKRKKNNINNYYNFSEEDLKALFKKKKYKKVVEFEEGHKEDVRKTKAWLELKCYCHHRQDGKDAITGSKLTKAANLHHMDLHEDNYGNFDSDNFVLLNTYSHKFLHFAAQQCHRIGKEEFLKRLSMLIDKMEELNDDIKTFPLAR